MGPLLVVLVTACALTSAVHIGRGFWARTRSVERHQQALDTLADITQSSDPVGDTKSLATVAPPQYHQAHVRVIGPAGPDPAPAPSLPPPRPFSRPSQVSGSPLRRPSRHAPSAAAIDAVTASATLGGASGAKLVRTGPPRPPAGPALQAHDVTLPALTPPPPAAEPPTRPVPVIKPHVFYFDDLSGGARPVAGPVPPDLPSPAAPASTPLAASSAPALVLSVSDHPPAPELRHLEDRHPEHRHLWAARLLAAAAVVVVVGAVTTAAALWPHSPRHIPALATRPAAPAKSTPAPASVPTTTTSPTSPTRPVTTTAPPPVIPASLVSAHAGTATYHLTTSSASIAVKASGPCWIEVRAGSPQGQVIYEGTLEKGQESSVTGPAWIRLGDPPYVAVMVNGARMSPPGATVAAPLNLQFTLG